MAVLHDGAADRAVRGASSSDRIAIGGRCHEPFGLTRVPNPRRTPSPGRDRHLAGRDDPSGPLGGAVRPLPAGCRRAYGRAMSSPSARAVRIRPITPADHDALRAFYAGLSDESRRTRFLGTSSGICDRQSTYFCCPDHAHREGFVATLGGRLRPERIVGHVCIEPDSPLAAEVAVAVADELQGRGIGRRLVDAAVDWARRDGVRTLTATMLGGNPAIQRLLTGLGLPTSAVAIGAGLVEIRIDLGIARSAA
jgi:GNAT superfamily N-acetyltransferase